MSAHPPSLSKGETIKLNPHQSSQCLPKSPNSYSRLKSQDNPTSHLFIGNCGIKTGFTERDLFQLFEPFGPILNIVIGDGYSFITLCSPELSATALRAFDGKIIEYDSVSSPCLSSYTNSTSSLSPPSPNRFGRRPLVVRFCKRHTEFPILLSSNCSSPENVPSQCENLPCLRYCDWILSDDESQHLLSLIDGMTWETLLRRRVQHYGYRFDYSTLTVDSYHRIDALPTIFDLLIERLLDREILLQLPDQITVNEYLPGEGIGFHVDTHSSFAGGICTVSLGSDTVMEFRKILPPNIEDINLPTSAQFGKMELLGDGRPIENYKELVQSIREAFGPSDNDCVHAEEKDTTPELGATQSGHADYIWPTLSPKSNGSKLVRLQNGNVIVSRILKVLRCNSACCFDDEIRLAYEHGIVSRSTDRIDSVVQQRGRRVSITLRTIRSPSLGGCKCSFPLWCDSQNPSIHRPPTRLKRVT